MGTNILGEVNLQEAGIQFRGVEIKTKIGKFFSKFLGTETRSRHEPYRPLVSRD